MTLAEMLYIRRSTVGLSQAAVANVAGVSRGAVQSWEAGASEPSAAALGRLLTALAVHEPAERARYYDAPRGAA